MRGDRIGQDAFLDKHSAHRAAAGAQGKLTKLTDDSADAPASVLASEPADQGAQRRRHTSPATDPTGLATVGLLAKPALVCLDTDDPEDLIDLMVDRRSAFQQPLPILRREDHAIPRHFLPQQFDLKLEESQPGVAPGRPGLRDDHYQHHQPLRQYLASPRFDHRKFNRDRCPTFWTTAATTVESYLRPLRDASRSDQRDAG